MRRVALMMAATAVLLVMTAATQAQVCGDVNSSGKVSLGDVLYYINWIVSHGPAPANPAMADCDERSGQTVADISRILLYLFTASPAPNCYISMTYGYNSALDDTVFAPRMLNIPEDIQSVALPIVMSFQENTIGFHLAFLNNGVGSNQAFAFDSVHVDTITSSSVGRFRYGDSPVGDTLVLAGCEVASYSEDWAGSHLMYTVWFKRTQAGLGNIVMDPTDRSTMWRFAIVKEDGDLYVPTIVIADQSPDYLQVSRNAMSFTANVGFPLPEVKDSAAITSTGEAINWHAEVSDDWIVLDAGDGTTPSQLRVSVNGPDLSAGIYTGTVTIKDVDHQFAPAVKITVTFTQRGNFPSMDANCDGKFNISDMTYLLRYMFGMPPGPAPCDPCSGVPAVQQSTTVKTGTK
jgi:hypothetical protein